MGLARNRLERLDFCIKWMKPGLSHDEHGHTTRHELRRSILPNPIATSSQALRYRVRMLRPAAGATFTLARYSRLRISTCVCPWCIADGSAHTRFNARVHGCSGCGRVFRPPVVPTSVIEEVAFRTPGFSVLASGSIGLLAVAMPPHLLVEQAAQSYERHWPDAISSIQKECGMVDGVDWQGYLRALDKDGSPTAYIFRCLHCDRHLGYSDCH